MAGGVRSKLAKAIPSSAAATPPSASAAFSIPDRVIEHAARVRAFVALCPINRNTLSKDFPLNKRWLSANQEQHGLKGAEHQVKYGFRTTFSEEGLVSDAYERYLKEEDGGLPEHLRAILTANKVSKPGINDPDFNWACGLNPEDVTNPNGSTCTQCSPPKLFRTHGELRDHYRDKHPPPEKLTCHYEECSLKGVVQENTSRFKSHSRDYHTPIARRTCNLHDCPLVGMVFPTPPEIHKHEQTLIHQANPNPDLISPWILKVLGCPLERNPFLTKDSYHKHLRKSSCSKYEDLGCRESTCQCSGEALKTVLSWNDHQLVCPISPEENDAMIETRTCRVQGCCRKDLPFPTFSLYKCHQALFHPSISYTDDERRCWEPSCARFYEVFGKPAQFIELRHHVNNKHGPAGLRTCQEEGCKDFQKEFQGKVLFQEHCADDHFELLSENGDDIGSAFSPSSGDNDESDHNRKRKLNGLSDSMVNFPEPKRRDGSTKAHLTTCQDGLCRSFSWQFVNERSLAMHIFRCHNWSKGLSEEERKDLLANPTKLHRVRDAREGFRFVCPTPRSRPPLISQQMKTMQTRKKMRERA